MKIIALKGTLALLATLGLFSGSVQAVDSSPTPPAAQNLPITITAFRGEVDLEYVEIKNQTTQPIYLGNWQLQYQLSTLQTPLSYLLDEGWILPGNSLLIEPEPQAIPAESRLESIRLLEGSSLRQEVLITNLNFLAKDIAHKKRSNASIGTTGVLATDYEAKAVTLLNDELYFPQESTNGIAIVEILPNSKNCSVSDSDISCGDYIKIQNKSGQTVDLSNYRVRYGFQGQSSTKANTFNWHSNEFTDPGLLESGEYFTIYLQDDNQTRLSLPDDGRFVWIEDRYGIVNYANEPNASIEYPSASRVADKGRSWAFDEELSKWQWALPSPNSANTFVDFEVEVAKGKATVYSLKPCRSDQFRNPATNRCKLKSAATSKLKPCRSDQFRNPATNRCKSIASATSTLKPCRSDQFRNPETNRCKKINSSTSSLKPCRPDQFRNPATNRCKKIIKNTAMTGTVDEVEPESGGPLSSKSMTSWLVGLAGGGIVLYGMYEWRTEIIEATLRLKNTLGKGG